MYKYPNKFIILICSKTNTTACFLPNFSSNDYISGAPQTHVKHKNYDV